jgi:hypothetical protein
MCIAILALKMEAVYFTETLASTDESTWLQNPEKQDQQLHYPHLFKNITHIINVPILHRFQMSDVIPH